jgi:pantoate--beta-alanine ligase
MRILKEIDAARRAVLAIRAAGETVALVPTMGKLHEGHRSLIRAAKARCDHVAVTIFVNPTQFGPGEDFDAYPRTPDADLAACREEGVDLVFMPTAETMYAADAATRVRVSGLSDVLCGAHRPGHFDGVTTVVAKLFHILPAGVALFGEKDYQQLLLIKKMVADLNMPVEIVGCPLVREPDGLAMSSRNAYLSDEQRRQAVALSRALFAARDRVAEGITDSDALTRDIRREIESAGPCEIDYIEIVDPRDLSPVSRVDHPARICLAVRIGHCRLIDNIAVTCAAAP